MARTLTVCGALFFAIASMNACGDTSGEVVAKIGAASVTKTALAHWMALQAAPVTATISSLNTGRRGTKKQLTLGFLIASARTLGEAAELGISISDKQVKHELDGLRYREVYGTPELSTKEAELRKLLAVKGETQADQLWIMKVRLLAAKVQQKRSLQAQEKLTGAQVANYYKRHEERFIAPERRDIEAIMTYHLGPLKAAKREIEAGKDFMTVANRVNEEPEEAGLRLGLTRGKEKKRYLRDYFAAPAHVLVGPLKEILYYIFEVRKIVPARQKTLAEVQGQVRQQLVAGSQRQLLSDILDASERRWRAKTSCRRAYVVQQCGRYAG
jgi:foldase protein PrsA